LKLVREHPLEKTSGMPPLREGESVKCESVLVEEHMRAHPPRYNQMTLLEKMESEGIGTKATRADTISTLIARGYVVGQPLVPTELGIALIEAMRVSCPQIISTRLTREIEAELEGIENSGEPRWEFLEKTLSSLLTQLGEVRSREDVISERMRASVSGGEGIGKTVLGACPVCKEGQLWVVRSRSTKKRFVGCTHYSKGCRASAPLPQRGNIKVAPRPCTSCGWPVVYVSGGRRPWKLCVNDKCPSKVNVYRMQGLRKKVAR
jgi:DNA topoisomerase I